MSDHTKGRLEAAIYRHAGQPDTVCLKDEQGNELVNWMGFDGNVYTKATTRANAKRLAAGWNALDEAAETILALRKEVEDAKADAALARQGYETAYAEFDKKCRTVNRLVCEKGDAVKDIVALDRAIDEFLGDLRTRASWDKSNIDDDGAVILPCGNGVLYRLGTARAAMGKYIARAALATEAE